MLTALQHITDIAVSESKKTGDDKVCYPLNPYPVLACFIFHNSVDRHNDREFIDDDLRTHSSSACTSAFANAHGVANFHVVSTFTPA